MPVDRVIKRDGAVVPFDRKRIEDAIFAATGETKAPKKYRVLFVDRRAETYGPLAVALGRRAFPESASFSFAGWDQKGSCRIWPRPISSDEGWMLSKLNARKWT